MEMSRFDEAAKWLGRALDTEGKEGDDGKEMMKLMEEAKRKADT